MFLTLYQRSAWLWLSSPWASLRCFEYWGAKAEQRERWHPAEQTWPQFAAAEVYNSYCSLTCVSLYIQMQLWHCVSVSMCTTKTDNRVSAYTDCGIPQGFCLYSSFRQDQQGLARFVERELQRVSQRLDQLSHHHHHHHHHQTHTPAADDDNRPHTGKVKIQSELTWLKWFLL